MLPDGAEDRHALHRRTQAARRGRASSRAPAACSTGTASPRSSIDEIMGDAGLTRGGFYKHFSAKEDLYQAAVLQFVCAERPEPWQARHIDPAAKGAALARMIVDAYSSRDHLDDRDGSCPMIALPSDVSRGNGGGEVRLPPGARDDGRRLRGQPAAGRRRAAARARAGARRHWSSAAWCWRAPSTTSRLRTSSATARGGRSSPRRGWEMG